MLPDFSVGETVVVNSPGPATHHTPPVCSPASYAARDGKARRDRRTLPRRFAAAAPAATGSICVTEAGPAAATRCGGEGGNEVGGGGGAKRAERGESGGGGDTRGSSRQGEREGVRLVGGEGHGGGVEGAG